MIWTSWPQTAVLHVRQPCPRVTSGKETVKPVSTVCPGDRSRSGGRDTQHLQQIPAAWNPEGFKSGRDVALRV
jgi:hypothetical protein